MTDYAAAIKAVLIADVTLTNTLTGSIYTYLETGRQGISPTSTPTAYDANKRLKPCAVVKARATVPDNAINDDVTQEQSVKTVVEVYLYQDGAGTPATLETARNRVKFLLHGKQIGGSVHKGDEIRDFRDPEVDRAQVIRSDYIINSVEGV